MLEIVICEDNLRLLESYVAMINKITDEHNLNIGVKFTTTQVDELESFLKFECAELFIIDIDLKSSVTGFQLAQKIRQKLKKCYILFISAHLEYVFQSFKVRPFNFLPKPVGYEIFESNILEIYKDYLENKTEEPQKVIQLKTSGALQKIRNYDIVAIERYGAKTLIHLKNSRVYCNYTMSEILQMLDDKRFLRIHKSYICNKDYILEYRLSRNEILMENGICCSIGRNYKKGIMSGD